MKNTILVTSMILLAFFLGFITRQNIHFKQTESSAVKKVTGIGGIFFKCKDPEKTKAWYSTHLGLKMNQYGSGFEWREGDDPSKYGLTQWSVFPDSSKYFDPSVKEFMINYRVQNLSTLASELKKQGVSIVDSIESYDYGKFLHILDNDGNKIELWEPVVAEYDKITAVKSK